jgi:nucleoside-diphosphate kinase
MIKPDGVKRGLIGEVIGRFEKAGLKIRAMKMLHLSLNQARAFYAVHKERPFFDSLTQFMSSGPIVALILEGDNAIQVNRDLMGATDYRKAAPGTIRADFAKEIEANIVHGSDAVETAQVEIAFFFNALERV